MHKLFLLLCFSFPAFAHTIYQPHEGGTINLDIQGARNASLDITAPKWIDVEVTSTTTDDALKTVTLKVKVAATTTYRTAKLYVVFGISEYTFDIVQAGKLSLIIEADHLLTEQVGYQDTLKAWVVPDNADILPNLRFYPTKAGVLFEYQPHPGWLYLQTRTALYSARLASQ